MAVNLIQYAIPVFLLLIVVEMILSRVQRKDYYDFNDSLADLACGITQQLVGVFFVSAEVLLYVFFYRHRLLSWPEHAPLLWGMSFLAVDLAYYWFHRSCHRINLLWGAHAPHHQSEEYNLTVALRQGSFSDPVSLFFYLPLAVFGIPPVVFVVCKELNIIYQFWIHTRSIGRLGWFETLFNTPSHHRVHHGKNPKYIDKNHAGVLMIWDKLFGSFEPEAEEPVYGTVTPFASWNPLWANFQHWAYLWRTSRQLEHFSDRLKLWWMPPGWLPQEPLPQIPEVQAQSFQKFRTPLPKSLKNYLLFHFLLSLALALTFLLLEPGLSWPVKSGAVVLLLFGLLNISGLQEGRKWAWPAEILRLFLLLPITWALPIPIWLQVPLILLVLGNLGWCWFQRQVFQTQASHVTVLT